MGSWLKSLLENQGVPLLKALLDPVHHLLDAVPPAGWRLAVCLYLLIGGCWAWWLRRSYIYAGAPDQARWRDLRWWIPWLLGPYLFLYLFL